MYLTDLEHEPEHNPDLPDQPALAQAFDDLPWADGFMAVCTAVATGLNTLVASFRVHRADIVAASYDDFHAGWSIVNASVDRFVSTVFQFNGGSFEHISSVTCHMQDHIATVEAEFGRPVPSRPGSSQSFPSPYQHPSGGESPRSSFTADRLPSPSPFASHISTPSPAALSLLERIGSPAPSSPPYTREQRSRSPSSLDSYASRVVAPRPPTPLPRLASRMSPGPPVDPYASAANRQSPCSRGRPPSRQRTRRPPKDADRTVYVRFSNDAYQTPEKRTANGVLQVQINTALERHPSADVKTFRLDSLFWNARSTITLVANKPPNATVVEVACRRIAEIQGIPFDKVRAEPYHLYVSLAFNRVPCEDLSGNPITPQDAATPIFNNDIWREIALRPSTSFRWIPTGNNASSGKLAMQFEDDPDHSISHRLLAHPVLFPDGITYAKVLPDRNVVPQCANCWGWGHPVYSCRYPTTVCARCGGPHPASLHNKKAACCKDTQGHERDDFTCPHPPWCCNCGGTHYASDRNECPFARHRNDSAWLAAHPRALTHDRSEARVEASERPRPSASTSNAATAHTLPRQDATVASTGGAERCAAGNVDVVCIQELWYGPLRPIPSASPTGPAERTDNNMLYGTQLHPAWTLVENRKDARVVCHVNRKLANAVISLDSTDPIAILNVYNDVQNSAVRYLLDVAPRLPSLDIVGGDYNTHAPIWDPTYPADSRTRVGELLDLHAQLGLRLLSPPGVPTHYPHRAGLRETVIDLVWVPDDREHNLYQIRVAPEERGLSDHAVIHVHIPAGEWSYQGSPSIAPKSQAEQNFIAAILASTLATFPDLPNLSSEAELQHAVDCLFECITDAWNRNATPVTICNKSRLWWDDSCTRARDALLHARARLAYTRVHHPRLVQAACAAVAAAMKRLKSAIRARRRQHMDERIRYVAEHQKRVWDLMSWVGPRALPTYRSLVHNGQPLRTLPELWRAFDQTFHAAVNRPTDPSILDSIRPRDTRDCPPIAMAEIRDALKHIASVSTPGWDHLHWRHLKLLLADNHFASLLLHLYNGILELGVWPTQFKRAVSVVIPKPYKDDYTRIKSYRPIVLLSTLGKLLEKVLSERLHYECQRYGILHPNQFGGTKAHSTIDAATALVTHVHAGWQRRMVTSCLAFDVAQFFPSMNHDLLCRILERYGFAPRLINFFRSYLGGRVSCFRWGRASSPWFDLPAVGAGQGSALSPVLTNIYLSPALHILFPLGSRPSMSALQFYVDDGVWIVTTPSVDENCRVLIALYRHTVDTLARLGLVIEVEKNELIHFISTRLARDNAPLALTLDDGTTIQPTQCWRYLGFRLDPQLTFRAHVSFFAERAMTTVHAMLMLGNSIRGLSPMQKRTLYISCVLPLMTYGVQVWYRSKGVKTLMKPLLAAEHRALRWITGAFRTTPIGAMQAFAGIMPLQLHCRKLQERYFLRIHTLPRHHPLRASFPHIFKCSRYAPPVRFPVDSLRPSPEIPLTQAFPDSKPIITEKFNTLDPECAPGRRICDLFDHRITRHLEHPNKKNREQLDEWIRDSLRPRIDAAHADPDSLVLFTDGSAVYSERHGRQGRAAGYRAYHGGRLLRAHAVYTGFTLAYDCELMALSMAVGFAYLKSYHTVHLFADNESALKSLLDTSTGRGTTINTCRILRDWFERNERNHLILHYCPSHSGIDENEAVDADVRFRVFHPGRVGRPFPYSFAFVRSGITDNLKFEWKRMADASPSAYWGRFHFRHPTFRQLLHTGRFPLR
ncbi:hypothetical protein BN946_scf184843.g12 [Trametes cinnabarina]|uniref:Reverse transcriptase domain-containing protein n=1 Tax=Pycnoporus cinnabarinus TaxID=5643 RepID=A0A060SD80_PYCCI|nr:hypothetical protein BN946_scf184843.g12 [Trametes cinnabarina]